MLSCSLQHPRTQHMYFLPGAQVMPGAIFHLIEAKGLQVFAVSKTPVTSVVQYKGFFTSFLQLGS